MATNTYTSTGMNNYNSLGNTLKNEQKEAFYERALLERLLPLLHAYTDAQKYTLPKNSGLTVQWRRFESLGDADSLTEGVTPGGKNLSVTAVKANAVQYGDYITISDILAAAGIDKATTEASQLCGEQAALKIEKVILSVLQSKTCKEIDNSGAEQTRTIRELIANGKTASTVTATDKITEDDIQKAVLYLKEQNARRFEDGYFHALVTPGQAYQLMKLDENSGWISAAKYGSIKKLLKGEIGELHGVRFMESTVLTPVLSSASDAYGASSAKINADVGVIYGADTYGVVDMEGGAGKPKIITKGFGSAGVNDPLDQRATVGWKNLFAAQILNYKTILRLVSPKVTI